MWWWNYSFVNKLSRPFYFVFILAQYYIVISDSLCTPRVLVLFALLDRPPPETNDTNEESKRDVVGKKHSSLSEVGKK